MLKQLDEAFGCGGLQFLGCGNALYFAKLNVVILKDGYFFFIFQGKEQKCGALGKPICFIIFHLSAFRKMRMFR